MYFKIFLDKWGFFVSEKEWFYKFFRSGFTDFGFGGESSRELQLWDAYKEVWAFNLSCVFRGFTADRFGGDNGRDVAGVGLAGLPVWGVYFSEQDLRKYRPTLFYFIACFREVVEARRWGFLEQFVLHFQQSFKSDKFCKKYN